MGCSIIEHGCYCGNGSSLYCVLFNGYSLWYDTYLFSTDALTLYKNRLKQVYKAPPPTWDPLPQCRHIKLAMIREKAKRRGIADEEMIKNQMKGAVEAIMASKVPVEKDKIFDSGLFDQERQVILVEGPPGGGKTSLAYYYGQKWASGNLSMFDIVAFVRLRDLAVTPANTLPDLLLLACCATKDDTLITKEMIQQYVVNCPKLLFVLDGWDEAPNDIRKPLYVAHILRSITSQSKILITSRPDSSVNLHGLANRVVIVGFTEEKIHEYFKEALSTELDHDKVEDGCRKLQKHFRSYPVIQSCCSIPLNAAILASLFLSKQSLPSTRHELFLKLVLSCINREQQDRHSQIEYVCVSSLDDLPHDLKVQLNHLCVLAFEGVKQNKVVFTEEDLVHQNLPLDLPGLGVLQIVDRFVAIGGKTAYRYFIHLSIQELLAAYYISQLGEDEQVKVFKAFLDESRFSAVLQFYAAFTRLTNQGVRNIITARDFDYKKSSKLSLLNFIRCFFEAQIHNDTSLFQQLIPRLNSGVDLSEVTMTPLDFMSIGYFMTSLLRAGGNVSVHLCRCSIDDYSLSLLVGEFSRHAEVCPAGVSVTELDISQNVKITEIGIAHVFQANITSKLKARWCGISNLEMESLARALAANSTLEELDISRNNIGDEGIGHIGTALLTNTTLKILDISKCVQTVWLPENLDTGGGGNHMNGRVHICTALQKNTTLKTLNFSCCGLSDLVAESLARALAVNCTLEELNISDNEIGDNGIGHIGTALLNNTTLKILNISNCASSVRVSRGRLYTDTDSNCIKGRVHICTALQKNTTLKTLNFSWCGVSDLVAESLARVLAVHTSLEELDISNNNIGDKGIGHIGTALMNNTTLKILNISKCFRGHDTDSNCIKGRVHICTALQKNTTLKVVNFDCSDLSDLVAESLARALEVNSSLEEVIIDENITDNGIVHIAKSLQKNNTLKFLHVGTGLTDKGVLSLARGVATNTSMERLWMRWHSVDPESALKIMAESVKKSSLKKLSLYTNSKDKIEAPVKKSSLQKLSQYINRISTQGRDKKNEWYHSVEVGAKELILSLEDSHLESFELIPYFSSTRSPNIHPLQLQAAIDSVNSARHKKGLPSIHFKIPGLT